MQIKYKIVQFIDTTATLVINYYCDEYPQGMIFHLDLPINPETKTTLSGSELDSFIMTNAPVKQLEFVVAQSKLVAQVDFSHITALIEPIPLPSNALTADGRLVSALESPVSIATTRL